MAGNRVPYIIDLIVSDKKLRESMAKLDWEQILGNKGKDFSQVLVTETEDAKQEIKSTLGNLSLDWGKILGQKDFLRLQQIVSKVITANAEKLKTLGREGDVSGIQNIIDWISALGDELNKLGSPLDKPALVKSMSNFMKVLTPISAKLDELSKEPKKVSAAFEKLFNNNNNKNVVEASNGFIVAAEQIGNIGEQAKKYSKDIEALQNSLNELSNTDIKITIKDNVKKQFHDITEQLDAVDDKIDELKDKELGSNNLSEEELDKITIELAQKQIQRAKLYRNMAVLEKRYKKDNPNDSLFDIEGIAEDPNDVVNEAKNIVQTTINTLQRSVTKVVQGATSSTNAVGIALKLPNESDLINTLNQYIDSINKKKTLHKIQVDIDDTANVIENKEKRAYKNTPADNDANTTALIEQTERRFDRIKESIDKKQGEILTNTKEWRKEMLEQFKFKSGDFEFKFNDTLIQELQALFDNYSLDVHINTETLANEIKTVLGDSQISLGGGTANVNSTSIANAIAEGFQSILLGQPISNTTSVGAIDNQSPQITEHIATELNDSALHLDLAEDYVKDVVKKLKAVAKYALKDKPNSIAVRKKFDFLGFDLQKINTANDTEIVSMLEKILLSKDEFGKLQGSTIIDNLLSYTKDNHISSKTIPRFLDSISEMFFMLQADTESVQEWVNRRNNKDVFEQARSKAKAALNLQSVRSTIYKDDIPDLQSIQDAIVSMEKIGADVDKLNLLKTAREELGNQTDDVAVEKFKNSAKEFYQSSGKIFYNLKDQAEKLFKGTIYLQGKNKPIEKTINTYRQLAGIQDDAVIVDIKIHSSLNDVALGEVKSKSSNRTSRREEERLMRGSSQSSYLSKKEYQEDILNRGLSYKGFKPQGMSTTDVNLDATKKRVETDIQTSKEQIKELDKRIDVLNQQEEETSTEINKLKNISNTIGNQPTYKSNISDDYIEQYDILASLYRNSRVINEANLPISGYPTVISDAIKERDTLKNKLAQLSKHVEVIDKLTIDEAKKRLDSLSKNKVSDEDMTLYKKYIENPVDMALFKKNRNIPGYSQEEINKLRNLSLDDIKQLISRGESQREYIDLYSQFIQNPEDIKKKLSQSIQQASNDLTLSQNNIDSYILNWAKSEEAKIPEAEKIFKQSAEKLLSKISSTINSFYKEITTTEEKLQISDSDDEKTILTAHIQDLLNLLEQSQNEYENIKKQSNVQSRRPLGTQRLGIIESLKNKYSSNDVRGTIKGNLSSLYSNLSDIKSNKSQVEQQRADTSTNITNNQTLLKRIQLQQTYNELKEKSLMLQGSIQKLEADEANTNVLNEKKAELEKINVSLAETESQLQVIGGFVGQIDSIEYSDNERKSYALKELTSIEDDLITAKAQKRIIESRISKKDKEMEELNKWGLGAGIGAIELGKTKSELTYQFMNSDYVKSQEEILKEDIKRQINDKKNELTKIFNDKVVNRMSMNGGYSGINVAEDMQRFLQSDGKDLAEQFDADIKEIEKTLWQEYDNKVKEMREQLRNGFKENLITDKGVARATFKTQNENGEWIDNIVEVNVKDAIKSRLEEEKKILESKKQPIQNNIDKLEADKASAIQYGGISEAELLSNDIIQDQIRKEIELSKWQAKRAEAEQKLNQLIEAGISEKDDTVKATKKDIAEAEKQITRYDMLVKNRQKLVQLRYDESKATQYTPEEKQLHFTNQIATYNEKIEDSLKRQEELKKKIETASDDEKTKLQYQLQQEETNVAKWKGYVSNYGEKLNRVESTIRKAKGNNIASITSSSNYEIAEGGLLGTIIAAFKEAISSSNSNIEINTSDLAKDSTLREIIKILGGNTSALDDAEWERKQARIRELEAKDPSSNGGLGRRENVEVKESVAEALVEPIISKQSSKDAKEFYKSWNVKPQDLDFDTVKAKAIALKQVIDTLYDEGKSDTEEFINAQTELSKLLSAWRNKLGKSTNPEFYNKENGKNAWISYLTSGDTKFFDNLNNVELSSISQKDYLSRLKKIKSSTSESATSEEKKPETTVQIKDFDDFKLKLQALKQSIETQTLGEEEQQKLQAAFIQVLKAWSKNEASGLSGKALTSKEWESYLINNGIFDSIDTSITPLTSRQLNRGTTKKATPKEKIKTIATSASTKQSNTSTGRTPAEEAEYQRLLAEIAGGPPSNNDNTTNGGLIQIVNDLAKQDTLLKVLSALQEIAKMQSGTTGVNAAGDLYKQLKALLLGGSIDDHERLAYMNLETGVLSADVIGTRSQVNQDLINQLRAKYSVNDGFNTQIHSHGQSDIPYFSNQDYDAFVKDYQDGIKKQVLLTKDSITVLDLTAVQSVEQVQSLMDSLKKAGTDAKAVQDALEKTGAGATYNNRKFDELNANSLVKMLGIKGIESRYSESETREMARKGVADEAAKEAANILQESTGRAIKKTVERVGLELETTTERTDVKGNKVWTSEISNKYKKAMKATNDKIMEQNLEQVFGTDTEAFNALQEYTAQYNKLVDLANKFDANPKDDSLQKEINDTLPLLDKAEEKLISLINRKNKFIDSKETVGTFSQSELGDAKSNLHNLAISRYSGKNIAFNGLRGTNNGVELLVDVLDDGVIKQYALEVDKTTGQVRELMVAENALANALQNVNQVMRQNEIVQAKVAIGDNPTQQEQFMQAAQSKEWNAYKSALNELEKYVADKWAKIQKNIQIGKGKTTFSQKELDYIMTLSEKVLALGKAVQNTSIAFKNFWAQNPDDVKALNIDIKDVLSRDEQVRRAMENYAKVNAEANASRYDFVSFDNDTLKYKLTDIEGNVRNITLVWNELYKQIAFVSDKSVSALDPLVAKIQQYDEVINQAKNDHYLLADDDSLTAYESIKTKIDEIIESIKSSGTYTEEQIAELDKLRKSAIDAGANVNKTINKNKKLYTGTNELNAVNRQRNKIIGTYSVDILSDEQNKAIKNYVDAYKNLNNTYNDYVTNHKISDPEIQKQLAQQAIGVQNLGKELIQTLTKEEKLTQLVQQSGSFKDKQGITYNLGRSYQLTDAEMKDLSQTMLVYAQKAVGSAAIESKKFDAAHQKMILTVRTSKNEVADLTAEVIDDTKKMYLYQTQARESLTGFDAFKRDFKAKLTSIGAYLASMTSIYKVWNTLQQGVQYVREIDSALTELKKVTDETEESYDRFLQTASKTADKVGSTIKEIVSSTADWARLGYSMEDAASLAESTSVLLNVSEFSSIDDATSALISTMQAFGYAAKDSMHVVDVMNEIGKFIACR